MVISDVYTSCIEAAKGAILPCALDLSSCSITVAAGNSLWFDGKALGIFLILACQSEFRHLYHRLGIAVIHERIQLLFSFADMLAGTIERISYSTGCGDHFKDSLELGGITGTNGLCD